MMHAGRVLAQGPPAELVKERKAKTLEEAFIGYLEEAAEKSPITPASASESVDTGGPQATHASETPSKFSIGRIWAFARREAVELQHDSVRLAFAVLGPLLLMVVFGYGISLDVDHLTFAVLDLDGTPASRVYADSFRGSYYFDEKPPLSGYHQMDRRLRNGELRLAIEIPTGFQKDTQRGRQPEVNAVLDAAVPFRAETARSYVEGVHDQYLARA
jgi:ribosome-dependent ATPase